jgi:ABC-type branched-subunit amino acid transport system ATPase component
MVILEIKNLTMRFGGLTAVNGFNCRVLRGQIFSIIGPNGAGKTTVFNAITGIYPPTSGQVLLAGHESRRPFSWRVAVGCALIGLMTGLASLVISINVDRLWHAVVKRPVVNQSQPFSLATAWGGFWAYVRGDLAVERNPRNRRWSVVTADGARTLAAGLRDEQDALYAGAMLQDMIRSRNWESSLVLQDGQPLLRSADGNRDLIRFDSLEAARAKLAQVGTEQALERRIAWLALVAGTAVGAAGAFTVWHRARRTPDVVAQAGIARTFQNIRLFHDMTVLENVLVGLDRSFRAAGLRMLLRTRGIRRQEAERCRQAMAWLSFADLASRAQMLAKNLAYGDQRRLEIARALATDPRLLLLDEPAAGMNPSEAAALMQLIRRIRDRGITVLLIEHHMPVVMGISDHISVLNYGSKIAEGRPDEIRSNPLVIQAYLGNEDS